MIALVTGANGLIGSNLVRTLLEQGHRVRALVRPTSDLRSLEGVGAERVLGDILDVNSLCQAAEGCDLLFHVAAIFAYSGHTAEQLMDTARWGAVNAVEAAHEAGIKRLVLTSSSVVFGSTLEPVALREGEIVTEPDEVPYVASKVAQVRAAFERADELGVDIVGACPTVCVGPSDYGLSESNAVITNYLQDPLRATWPGGCNIVSVHDVAQGHLLAAERGQPAQLYLLGAENLEWSAVHAIIADLCGIDRPLTTATHTISYLAAAVHEILSLFTEKRPLVSRAQAKMVGHYYWYHHGRAAELGYRPRGSRRALAEAVSWLVQSEHVSNAVRSSLRLSPEVYACR